MEDNKFLFDANAFEEKVGAVSSVIGLRVIQGLEKTCNAFTELAKTQIRDDALVKVEDNYTLSLTKLLFAFDCFIIESLGGGVSAGKVEIYDFKKPSHLTIYLLWLIRHAYVHNGGIIDEKNKRKYENKIKVALKEGVQPIIPLPDKLSERRILSIKQSDFLMVKEAVFDYLKAKLPPEQIELLRTRAALGNLKVDWLCTLDFGSFLLRFNVVAALDAGVGFDKTNQQLEIPAAAKYDAATKQVIMPYGKTFAATLITKSTKS